MCPEQTIKMTKTVPARERLYYRGSCRVVGIESQFLHCDRVGGEKGGEEEREEKQRRAAELHHRAHELHHRAHTADRRASAPVMD